MFPDILLSALCPEALDIVRSAPIGLGLINSFELAQPAYPAVLGHENGPIDFSDLSAHFCRVFGFRWFESG